MITVYEYAHDSVGHITLTYFVASAQPIAGGADANESARIIRPVHRAASVDEARAWIVAAIPVAMRRYTHGEYSISERAHSQAIICISAEASGYDQEVE